MGIGQTRSILENPDRPWKVTSPVKGKSIWNSYSPGLVTYKGVDPYPRQVVGRGPWRYGRTIVYNVHSCMIDEFPVSVHGYQKYQKMYRTDVPVLIWNRTRM